MGKFLQSVTSGLVDRPLTVVLYGREGIGKTTWAKFAPRPIFMCEPGGSDEIEVERMAKINNWEEALGAIDELRMEQHPYQTFVLDTADWLEQLIWDEVCRRGIDGTSKPNVESFGYGRGYKFAMTEWRILVQKFEDLQDRRNMNVVVLCHSHIKTFDPPDGEKYDRYEMKLNGLAAGLLKEWPKALLFANFETYTKKENKSDRKSKAYGEGARIVHTQPRPSWDAKSRYRGMPSTLPLSWQDFESAARARNVEKPEDTSSQVEKLLGEADELTRTQGAAALERCGKDPQKLSMLAEWLRGKVVAAAE